MNKESKLLDLNKEWVIENNKLIRHFKFKDFQETFMFMKKVAVLAEELRHHPQWSNTYNKLEIMLWTHEINGLSNLDFKMAKKINQIFDNSKKT
jgi:4a-hydroxytetrahydrobiopterin dehydratase|tara:strand:+ start:188 stop:469 length:282 start_codon:yes stop_codon:yes gene_type:complete